MPPSDGPDGLSGPGSASGPGSPTLAPLSGKALSDGRAFIVPGTTSFVKELTTPSSYRTVPTQIYVCCFLLTAFTALYPVPIWMGWSDGSVPSWFYIANFFVWRLGYDAGIGYILYRQSHSMWWLEWFKSWIDDPKYKRVRGWLESIPLTIEGHQVPYKCSDYPHDFNAWMLFRFVVNVILANDFVAHCVLCFVFWEIPWDGVGLVDCLQYALGLFLMFLAYYAKSDAHRVIGNFAWYWGDFFFLFEADLTFDGIFQMFPHPMYTVGYAFYYGLSLISKSYVVFYCSVTAHVLQMIFLAFVESPHIEKIYGSIGTEKEEEQDLKDFQGEARWYTQRRDMVLLFNLNIFRASDVFTILILVYSALFMVFVDGWAVHLVHLILWRAWHTGVLGYVLRQQTLCQFWTKQFSSEHNAFDNWKKLYNLSMTMNHVVFFALACRSFEYMPEDSIIRPGDFSFYCFKLCLGVILVALQIWVSNETHTALGDFGWFYGDYFIQSHPRKLNYSGIYRYMNNPESVMGFCGYYGLAMIASSYSMGIIAILCHVSQILFTHLVETPHMRNKYGEDLRPKGGLRAEVSKKTRRLRFRMREQVESTRIQAEGLRRDLVNEVRRRIPGRHSDSEG